MHVNTPVKKRKMDEERTLTVKFRSFNPMYQDCRIKCRSSPVLKKVMDRYREVIGVYDQSVRFSFDGEAIKPGTTPDDLEMEDEDVIDVMVQLKGS